MREGGSNNGESDAPASGGRDGVVVGGDVADAHHAARVGEPDAAVEEQQVLEGEGAAHEGVRRGRALAADQRCGGEEEGHRDGRCRRHFERGFVAPVPR